MSMNKPFSLVFILISLIASTAITIQTITIKADSKTIIVPDDYSTIQAAINNALEGDTIFVREGTYNQAINITKGLSLIGENNEATILTAPAITQVAMNKNNDATNGANYELLGAKIIPLNFLGPPPVIAVQIEADNVKISDFNITGCNIGIIATGNKTKIVGNNIRTDGIGPAVSLKGTQITVAENKIFGYGTKGIECDGSYNNIINNSLAEGDQDIHVGGSFNRITGNSGFPIRLGEAYSNVVSNNTSPTLQLVFSSYNNISGNTIK